jgi:hypothetical protein
MIMGRMIICRMIMGPMITGPTIMERTISVSVATTKMIIRLLIRTTSIMVAGNRSPG